MARFPILVIAVMLASCSDSAPKRAGDEKTADPALTSALADPIMVDPQLGAQANTDTIRPPDMPMTAPIPAGSDGRKRQGTPVTLGSLAREQAAADRSAAFAGCNLAVSYSLRWSNTLPPDLKLPDAARVTEAAGSDSPACRLRVVSYAEATAPDQAIARYRSLALQAGYAVDEAEEAGAKTLSARRKSDGAAFTASIAPGDDGGSTVDLMSNRGR